MFWTILPNAHDTCNQRFLEGCLCFKPILLGLFHLCLLPKQSRSRKMQFAKKEKKNRKHENAQIRRGKITGGSRTAALHSQITSGCASFRSSCEIDDDKGCSHRCVVVLSLRNGPTSPTQTLRLRGMYSASLPSLYSLAISSWNARNFYM
jgi:hypothetical protein